MPLFTSALSELPKYDSGLTANPDGMLTGSEKKTVAPVDDTFLFIDNPYGTGCGHNNLCLVN